MYQRRVGDFAAFRDHLARLIRSVMHQAGLGGMAYNTVSPQRTIEVGGRSDE
jgi:hypothetical protein